VTGFWSVLEGMIGEEGLTRLSGPHD
jgi:hypothetical protein